MNSEYIIGVKEKNVYQKSGKTISKIYMGQR